MYKLTNNTLYRSFWIFMCACILQSYTIPTSTQTTKVNAVTEKETDNPAITSNTVDNIPSVESKDELIDAVNAPSTEEPLNIGNYFSPTETQLLRPYLDTSSDNTLLSTLIQAVGNNRQAGISETALNVIRKILIDNPSNTTLFEVIANGKDPDKVKNILLIAHIDAVDKNRNENLRVGILRMLNSIANTKDVISNPKYMDEILNIVLQDAQDPSIVVTNEVAPVIIAINQKNPEAVQNAFVDILRSTKSEDYAIRSSGLNILRFFIIVDPTYAQQVFQAAIDAMQDPQPLVRWNALAALAKVVSVDSKLKSSDPKYRQGTLEVALQASNEEDISVSTMALRLLKELVKLDTQYPSQALNTAITTSESKYKEVAIEGLKLLATIVNKDAKCAPAAFEAGNNAMQNSDEQIRWNGLLVLLSIAKVANAEYAQKVFDIAVKATTDKVGCIREDGLVTIHTIVQNNPQYAIKAFPTVNKLTKDGEKSVQIAALTALETLLKANPQLTTNIYSAAYTIVKDKTITLEVRKQVWHLLEAILKIDARYVQRKEFRDIIREASLDADATIRQVAHDLLVTYLLKE